MLAATAAGSGPILVIGTDCPALTEVHLRGAANALRNGTDVILIPAEDGGYVLIGTRSAQPPLFAGIAWGTKTVLAETRARIIAQRLILTEQPPLWDVDTEDDLARLEREYPDSNCNRYCRRIRIKPQTMRHAATMRAARNGSLSTTTAMTAPNSTLVSRKVATMAIGAAVIAQIAIP